MTSDSVRRIGRVPSTSRSRAVLIGYFGVANLGDELMLVCFAKWLSWQSIEFTVAAENAQTVAAETGLQSVQNYPLLGQWGWVESLLRGKVLGVLRAISASDYVICGGGEILRDGIGWRTFSYHIEKLVFAILLGKSVFLLNVGIPPPVTRYGRFGLRWLLPRCRGIVVRESRSLEVCRLYGAGGLAQMQPDIVGRVRELFPQRVATPKRLGHVLVALRGDPNVYGGYDLSGPRLDSLAAGLDSLVEAHGVSVAFLACQSGNEGDDHRIHRELQKRMLRKASTELLGWSADIEELNRRFNNSLMVIAMRLHAAVLAVAFQKPCVLLPYDQKVADFGVQVGIPYVLLAADLDARSNVRGILDRALREKAVPVGDSPEEGDWLTLTLDKIGCYR